MICCPKQYGQVGDLAAVLSPTNDDESVSSMLCEDRSADYSQDYGL